MNKKIQRRYLGYNLALLVCSLWYLGTVLSYRRSLYKEAQADRVDFYQITISADGKVFDSKQNKLSIDEFQKAIWSIMESSSITHTVESSFPDESGKYRTYQRVDYVDLALQVHADKHTKYSAIKRVMEAYKDFGGKYIIFNDEISDKHRELWVELPASIIDIEVIMPVVAKIQIEEDATVRLDGMQFDADTVLLKKLSDHLGRLKQVAESQHKDFYVNLYPSDETEYHRVVDVLAACENARVEYLTLSHWF